MENIAIRPSRDIRNNYAKLSKLTKQSPVAITVNGKEDTILLSHENYMALQNKVQSQQERIAFYERLAQAEDDIKLGRIKSLDQTFDSLIEKVKNGLWTTK